MNKTKSPSRPNQGASMSALVFLFSPEGRSFRECASGPLPDDLDKYRASPEASAKALSHFAELGFKVFEDDMRLTLTIEASPAQFAKVFNTTPSSGVFETPAALAKIVDRIVPAPVPEFF